MSALWNTAAHGPNRTRLLVWAGIVALYACTMLLPDIPGTLVRIGLMGFAFALIAASLTPHQSRGWQIALRIVFAVALLYAGIAALVT
jgi:hypothetical protein